MLWYGIIALSLSRRYNGRYQITGVSIVYSTVCSDADQRKHQSSASLAFVRGIHRWPVNSPHKWPVTRKMGPFDDVIMYWRGSKKHHVRQIVVTSGYVIIPRLFVGKPLWFEVADSSKCTLQNSDWWLYQLTGRLLVELIWIDVHNYLRSPNL